MFAALKILSEEENLPAMVNCAHGKDRTGLVTALVLSIMGKDKHYIAQDYARSEVSQLLGINYMGVPRNDLRSSKDLMKLTKNRTVYVYIFIIDQDILFIDNILLSS